MGCPLRASVVYTDQRNEKGVLCSLPAEKSFPLSSSILFENDFKPIALRYPKLTISLRNAIISCILAKLFNLLILYCYALPDFCHGYTPYLRPPQTGSYLRLLSRISHKVWVYLKFLSFTSSIDQKLLLRLCAFDLSKTFDNTSRHALLSKQTVSYAN